MREVFRNDFFYVLHDSEARVVRIARTALPQPTATLLQTAAVLPPLLIPLLPARLLLDMRLAPGNNEPGFEQKAVEVVQQLTRRFKVVAILVQTAVGKLHFQRMSRTSGQPLHIFFDETEALRYLNEQPLGS